MKDKIFCKLLVLSIGLAIVASGVAVGASKMDKMSNGSDYNVSRSSATIYVPDAYPTIQAAANAVSAGDTIIVRDGYYIENVDVNKRLTIRSENGPGSTTIRTAPQHTDDHVFDVTVDYVNISGFSVEGSYDNAGIHLYYADYCNISNNICSNNAFGISIDYSTNSSIINNDCTNNDAGIALFESSNNSISNNSCSSNNRYFGIGLLCSNNNTISKNMCYSNKWNSIYLGHSRNNIISNNFCSSNSAGIYFETSNSNIISNNTCSNNGGGGISLGDSNNNSISNNTCSKNQYGILFRDSNSNKLRSNILIDNSIFIWGNSLRDYTHEIDRSNTVNGKPVYYWKDVDGGRIHDGAGQVILVNCSNVVVENQKVVRMDVSFSSHITMKNNEGADINFESANNNCISNNTGTSITLERANNNCISNNTWTDIYLNSANNNRIFHNICSNNSYGICSVYSNNNSISNNHCYNCSNDGILLIVSDDNGIFNNTCSNNGFSGIRLQNSNNNHISKNNCSNSGNAGIVCKYSYNNKLKGNVMVDNGIFIAGETTSDYTNEIDTSNVVNGKPVYYWKDVEGGRIPDGAGQVILVNCKNVIVEKQNLNNASVGIAVVFSSYISIKNNNCSNNKYYGIYLLGSNSNNIFLNNFINNTDDVFFYMSANTWNSTEKITYQYSGNTYTNYLGNYWADYKQKYPDAEEIGGIWDTPYSINSDKDNYPLRETFENYILTQSDSNRI
jgi:parallel beta-helix repeat protein